MVDLMWRNILKEFDLSFVGAQYRLFFASKIPTFEYHTDHRLRMTIPSDTWKLKGLFFPKPGIWWRGLCPQHSPSTHNDKHSCLWPSGSIPVIGIAFFLHSSQLDDDVYIVNWLKTGWKLGAEGPLFVCIPFSPRHRMAKDSFFQLMFPSIATWES